MGLFVNTNISSLQGRNQVDKNQSVLTSTLQKLSSGLRINSSKDDASGMAVAEGLTSRIRGNDMGVRNANDAISVAQTAESALTQIIANTQRIRDIAVQSTSSALQDTDRSKLQTEVDQLTQEISRIVQTTEFNGRYLLQEDPVLGAPVDTWTFQIGSSGVASNQVKFDSIDLNNKLTSLDGTTNYNLCSTDLTAKSIVLLVDPLGDSIGAGTSAISAMDTALGILINQRARFGAVQNRFEAVISNMKAFNENLTSARSRIQDADFASETANLTRTQILQQAGTAMLAQANQVPQSALSLLK